MNHIVSDFVIRFKNAARARKKEFNAPYSNITKAIGELLVREHFLTAIREEEVEGKRHLIGEVAYDERHPVMTDVEIVSKPSLRVYQKIRKGTPMENRGMIISVLSTNQGILSSREANTKGVGGEVLFRVW
jgi:small subunit ribosomal protein S8